MTSVASLRAARATGATAYAEYIKYHPTYPDRCFIFLEGKDDCCFYGQAVQAKRAFINISCGNKDGVLDALGKMQVNRPAARRCLFFVDKDLWDFLGRAHAADARLFITEHYSFENYIVSVETLERVWQDLAGLSLIHPLFEIWRTRFALQHIRFWRAMLPIMAWVLDVRTRQFKTRLNDFKLSTIFGFHADGELFRKTNTGIGCWEQQCLRDATYIRNIPHLKANYTALKQHPQKKWLRGKWELWFMQEFIRVMITDIRAKVADHAVTCDIHSGNAVQLLAPRTITPPQLNNLLDAQIIP